MEKLNINLLKSEKEIEKLYEEDRLQYIASRLEYNSDKSKSWAEAEWDKKYPDGIDSWQGQHGHDTLNSYGMQLLINKANEIVEWINEVQPIIDQAKLNLDLGKAEEIGKLFKRE